MKPAGKGVRPPGRRYEHKLFAYTDETGLQLVQEIARRRQTSVAALIRSLIAEEADRLGVVVDTVPKEALRPAGPSLTPEERAARVNAAFGALAHVPVSVDDYLCEKHEEAAREEERWARPAGDSA